MGVSEDFGKDMEKRLAELAEARAKVAAMKKQVSNVELAQQSFTRIWREAVPVIAQLRKRWKTNSKAEVKTSYEDAHRLEGLETFLKHLRRQGLPLTKQEVDRWDAPQKLIEELETALRNSRPGGLENLIQREIYWLVACLLYCSEQKLFEKILALPGLKIDEEMTVLSKKEVEYLCVVLWWSIWSAAETVEDLDKPDVEKRKAGHHPSAFERIRERFFPKKVKRKKKNGAEATEEVEADVDLCDRELDEPIDQEHEDAWDQADEADGR